MIVPYNPYQPLGGLNGGHWQANAQAHYNSAFGANLANQGAFVQYAAQQALYSQFAYAQALAQPAPEPIEDAGISAGEIIAWRCWKWRHGFLWSMATDAAWVPGETMTGDVTHTGVHAWKEVRGAVEYAVGHSCLVIVGQIKLWGDVIEHERGYRAENGKVDSIKFSVGWHPLKWLILRRVRRLYEPKAQG